MAKYICIFNAVYTEWQVGYPSKWILVNVFFIIDYLILLVSHTDCCSIYTLHYTILHHFPEDILDRIMLHDFHTKLFELKKITSIVMAKQWDSNISDFILLTLSKKVKKISNINNINIKILPTTLIY